MTQATTFTSQEEKPPIVSVVIAAFNEEQCISAAIQSIIDQSFTDWELIIIDDSSSDNTTTIARQYQREESRIKLIVNQENIGLAASLNRGLGLAKGKYIARMDADDFCYRDRLKIQLDFLDNNEGIAVVGGNADLVDDEGNVIRQTQMPLTPKDIKHSITKRCPLIHPSVMYRREFINKIGGYDNRLKKKQDYDLWLRGVDKYEYANLEEVIIRYKAQPSKPFKTDLYGFYVRLMNAHRRRKYLVGLFWAIVTLGVNVLRKIGYKQRSYRRQV